METEGAERFSPLNLGAHVLCFTWLNKFMGKKKDESDICNIKYYGVETEGSSHSIH